jgi:hypothetical protein
MIQTRKFLQKITCKGKITDELMWGMEEKNYKN